MPLIDIACAGQFRATWANIDVAPLIKDEVGTAKPNFLLAKTVGR
jgi:hypothetical protein